MGVRSELIDRIEPILEEWGITEDEQLMDELLGTIFEYFGVEEDYGNYGQQTTGSEREFVCKNVDIYTDV
jgi:hypothetical protein